MFAYGRHGLFFQSKYENYFPMLSFFEKEPAESNIADLTILMSGDSDIK